MSAFWASCSFLISEPFFGFGCWVFFAAMAVALENVPGRAHMQDWRTFPFFLTQEIWKHLEETPGLPQMNRMERLSRFLVNVLGMRNPSEQTMAVMCALICRTEMDPSRLSASLQTLKTAMETASSCGMWALFSQCPGTPSFCTDCGDYIAHRTDQIRCGSAAKRCGIQTSLEEMGDVGKAHVFLANKLKQRGNAHVFLAKKHKQIGNAHVFLPKIESSTETRMCLQSEA